MHTIKWDRGSHLGALAKEPHDIYKYFYNFVNLQGAESTKVRDRASAASRSSSGSTDETVTNPEDIQFGAAQTFTLLCFNGGAF